MTIVCKRVCYSGRVQGVGFRYTARQLATGFPISGSVRNLANGEVELIAEGDPTDVEAFLVAVAKQMADNILGVAVHDESPTGRQGFHIRH